MNKDIQYMQKSLTPKSSIVVMAVCHALRCRPSSLFIGHETSHRMLSLGLLGSYATAILAGLNA